MSENYKTYYDEHCKNLENLDREWAKSGLSAFLSHVLPGVGTTNSQYVDRELRPSVIDYKSDLSKEEGSLQEFVRSHPDMIQYQINQATDQDETKWEEIQKGKDIAKNLIDIAKNSKGKIPACSGLQNTTDWSDKEISPKGYHNEEIVKLTREGYTAIYRTAQAKYAYQTLEGIQNEYELDKQTGKIQQESLNYPIQDIDSNKYVKDYQEKSNNLDSMDLDYVKTNPLFRGYSHTAIAMFMARGNTNTEYVDEKLRPYVRQLQGEANSEKAKILEFLKYNPDVVQYKIDHSKGNEKESWERIKDVMHKTARNEELKEYNIETVTNEIKKFNPLDDSIRNRAEKETSTFTGANEIVNKKIVDLTRDGHQAIYDTARFQHTYDVLVEARNSCKKSSVSKSKKSSVSKTLSKVSKNVSQNTPKDTPKNTPLKNPKKTGKNR